MQIMPLSVTVQKSKWLQSDFINNILESFLKKQNKQYVQWLSKSDPNCNNVNVNTNLK